MTDAPKVPIQTATLAEIYLKQGFLEKARTVYAGILEEAPDDAVAQRRLTQIDQMLQGEEEAQNGSVPSAEPREDVLGRLNKWLRAIDQRRGHV